MSMHRFFKKQKTALFFVVFTFFYTFLSFIILGHVANTNQEKHEVRARDQQTFVTHTAPSEEVQVHTKVLAEKTNLERKLISPSSLSSVAQIKTIIQKHGGEIIETGANMVVANIPKDLEKSIEEELQKSKSIKTIEIDFPIHLAVDNLDWGVQRIKAPDVWPTTAADGMLIAVIDTGIDYTHQDLRDRYGGGYDIVNKDTDPFDDHGHGTHVSGIVASDLNGAGLAGVAPKAKILAIKALNNEGYGYISDLVEAIDYAMAHGAQIINYSLGTSSNSKTLEEKINQAAAKGIIQVAASGNTNGGSLLYPAAYGSVISVSATDSNDHFASFSSLGAELAAPGVAVSSTIPGGGYAAWSGTSMAAPHVTATVALMIANKQTNIRENLRNTAVDLGTKGQDSYFGYGLVHAKPAALGEDTLAPIVTFLEPENNAYINEAVTVRLDVQDEYEIKNVKLLINNQVVQEWSAEPYEYTWNIDGLAQGDYILLGQATDENDNIGEAQITVKISDITPTPTGVPTPMLHQMKKQGESQSVRQDVNQEQAQQYRQDTENVPNNPQEAAQKSDTAQQAQPQSQAPETTNVNERNQKPELPSQVQDKGKGVKGTSTHDDRSEGFVDSLIHFFKSLLK